MLSLNYRFHKVKLLLNKLISPFSDVFDSGVKPDRAFSKLHSMLLPQYKFSDQIVLPDHTKFYSQIEYARWVTDNVHQFGEGTYFTVSWNKNAGNVVLYPGEGATWKDGSPVEDTMKIRKKSHLLLEEIILKKPVPLVQRFIISSPYCMRGGGAKIIRGVLTPQYKSNVLNGRWILRGHLENDLRNKFNTAISKVTQ